MSETVRMLLLHGIAAARVGDAAEARRYQERVLQNEATHAQKEQTHWVANYCCDGTTYTVAVNGQSGSVVGQAPPGAVRRLLDRLPGMRA